MIRLSLAFALALTLAAGCSSEPAARDSYGMTGGGGTPAQAAAPAMDPKRNVNEQDCSRPVTLDQGNLLCK